jgi:hypothetical protein
MSTGWGVRALSGVSTARRAKARCSRRAAHLVTFADGDVVLGALEEHRLVDSMPPSPKPPPRSAPRNGDVMRGSNGPHRSRSG